MLSKFFFKVALVIIIFYGCQNDGNKNENNNSKADNVLSKYDSLILSTRAANPKLALAYASEAEKRSLVIGTTEAKIYSFLLKGNAYSIYNKDSAFFSYSQALACEDSTGCFNYRHKLLYNLGMLYAYVSDMKNAIKLLDSARYYSFKSSDDYTRAIICNSFGNIYKDIFDTVHARIMYDSALNIAVTHSYTDLESTVLTNLASLEANPDKIFSQISEAVKSPHKPGQTNEEMAMMLTNLTVFYNSVPDSGIYYNKLALTYITKDASPDVYINIYNNLAYCYLYKKDFDSAIICLRDLAIPMAMKTGHLDLLANLYDSYAEVYQNQGNFQKAYENEKQSNITLQNSYLQQGSEQVRLLSAMLDEKRREAQISEYKLTLADVRNSRNILILGLIIIITISFLFLYYFSQKKKMQLNVQKIESAKKIMEAEENERTKLGKEFHDIAGQKFSQMIAYHQVGNFSDHQFREASLKMISELKETVRTLTHKMNPDWILNFSLEESIEGLIADLQKSVPIVIESKIDHPIPDVSNEIKIQVFRIVQELTANYLKHSFGKNLTIHLFADKQNIIIKYMDEGPGFHLPDVMKNGIGISNIFQRVRYLNGTIEIDSSPGYGTYYEIKIPFL